MHWGDDTEAGSKIRFNHVSRQMIGLHDLVPTFCEIAGVEPGEDQALDSISFLPVLQGKHDDSKPLRKSLIVQACHQFDAFTARHKEFEPTVKDLEPAERHKKWLEYMEKRFREAKANGLDGCGRAVIMDGWKLCFNLTADEADYLSDMNTDPKERNNLIEAAHAKEMRDELEKEYRNIRSSQRSTPPSLFHQALSQRWIHRRFAGINENVAEINFVLVFQLFRPKRCNSDSWFIRSAAVSGLPSVNDEQLIQDHRVQSNAEASRIAGVLGFR